MPHSPLHKKKFKKNLAVLGLIIAFIAVFWIITMIRIAGAHEYQPDGNHARCTELCWPSCGTFC